jgi:hypothetical protein
MVESIENTANSIERSIKNELQSTIPNKKNEPIKVHRRSRNESIFDVN